MENAMDALEIVVATEEFRTAVADGSPGTVIRLVRLARGMTQAQLGQAVGYSASAISRVERGRLRSRDVVVLRRLATALIIPPELVGVSGSTSWQKSVGAINVSEFGPSDGGEMQRRRLLLGAVSVAGRPRIDCGRRQRQHRKESPSTLAASAPPPTSRPARATVRLPSTSSAKPTPWRPGPLPVESRFSTTRV